MGFELGEDELGGHVAGGVGEQANPLGAEGVGEEDGVVFGARQFNGLVFDPGSVAKEVDLDVDGGISIRDEVEHLAAEVGEEEGVGGFTGGDLLFAPYAAPALGLTPAPEVVRLAEPDTALWLACDRVGVLIR